MKPEAIKSFRETRGLSQSELASELGVDQATVSRAERGGPLARPVELLLHRLMTDVGFDPSAGPELQATG
jgi:transcriptional regulator with XRE-family HTH domain